MIPEIFMNKHPGKNTQAYMQVFLIFQSGSPIQNSDEPKNTPSARNITAYYADRKQDFYLLCGSI
jgi:hypothetical protein